MCAWTEMVMLKQRGVDCVCRLTSHRKADFRRGQRLGEGDHVVEWPKPHEAPVDRPGGVRRAARVPDGPRVPGPGGAAGVPDAGPRRRHDPAGRRGVHHGRPGPALPGAVERGTRSEVAEADAADGRAAVQDAGVGPEGALDPHPGVQPDPHGHGPGGGPARHRAAVDQLQGGGPDAGGVPAGDRPARRARPGLPPGALRAGCWTRSPATASAIDPTGSSRGGGSGGPSRTTASGSRGTRPNADAQRGSGECRRHSAHRPREGDR